MIKRWTFIFFFSLLLFESCNSTLGQFIDHILPLGKISCFLYGHQCVLLWFIMFYGTKTQSFFFFFLLNLVHPSFSLLQTINLCAHVITQSTLWSRYRLPLWPLQQHFRSYYFPATISVCASFYLKVLFFLLLFLASGCCFGWNIL